MLCCVPLQIAFSLSFYIIIICLFYLTLSFTHSTSTSITITTHTYTHYTLIISHFWLCMDLCVFVCLCLKWINGVLFNLNQIMNLARPFSGLHILYAPIPFKSILFAIVFHTISLECFHYTVVFLLVFFRFTLVWFSLIFFSTIFVVLLCLYFTYIIITFISACMYIARTHTHTCEIHKYTCVYKVTTLNDSTRFYFDFSSVLFCRTHFYTGTMKKWYKKKNYNDGNLTENPLHSNFCDRFACTTRYTQCTYEYVYTLSFNF